jgi:hypothetical protein
MAPELLQQPPPAANAAPDAANANAAPPPYDARAADAWALGVLLHLLLAGAYPFEDEGHPSSVAHTVSNVLSGRRRPLPEWVSGGARQAVAGLLQPDPARRTTLRALAADAWLLGAAAEYAKGVPGGAALVDLSAVSAATAGAAAAAAAAASSVSPLLPPPQQQQQQQAPSSAPASLPPPPSLPATPMAQQQQQHHHHHQAPKNSSNSIVQRLLAVVAGAWPMK